eukprot:TRINITY_DN4137_c0_g1_i1.p1 TRINITY_DN4137_c0_g1~~TRINITY_DN4137_c0_g1_i1.p1  ORF type:complete len:352 (+),score=61.31 TRINITY_DN4137_c0_g1_i1:14-1069(+)
MQESHAGIDALLGADLVLHSNKRRRSPQLWNDAEDDALRKAVAAWFALDPEDQNREIRWKEVCKSMPGRTPDQCCQRWIRVLDPRIKRRGWSPAEDDLLLQLVAEHGLHKWSTVALSIPGRTDMQCRYHYYAICDPTVISRRSGSGRRGSFVRTAPKHQGTGEASSSNHSSDSAEHDQDHLAAAAALLGARQSPSQSHSPKPQAPATSLQPVSQPYNPASRRDSGVSIDFPLRFGPPVASAAALALAPLQFEGDAERPLAQDLLFRSVAPLMLELQSDVAPPRVAAAPVTKFVANNVHLSALSQPSGVDEPKLSGSSAIRQREEDLDDRPQKRMAISFLCDEDADQIANEL